MKYFLNIVIGFYILLFSTINVSLAENTNYISVKSYGAIGDGKANDTGAIQKAFNDIPEGTILSFPKGTYLYSDMLLLKKNNVTIKGIGGKLKALNPNRQAIKITGDRVSVLDMSFQGVGKKRSSQPETTIIWVRGQHTLIQNNTIIGGASAGIFLFGAKNFKVINNTVHETLADGIHMTYGARDGVVRNNRVYDTGDDMIAVVTYNDALKKKNIGYTENILIKNNNVSGNTWGRGITVVGGQNILIESNNITDIPYAAGILIAQEKSFNTAGVKNVIIKNNTIARSQITAETESKKHTWQAGIDVNSSNQHKISNITISGNRISDVGYSGIRLLGNIDGATIEHNKISNYGLKHLKAAPINIVNNKIIHSRIICKKNTPAKCKGI